METARHLPRSCKPEPGGVLAVVDRGRCEAKSACVAVCPYDVFEVRALTSGERAAMPVWGRLNLRPHRGRQAVVVAPDRCHACGLCVRACQEGAIRLLCQVA